MIKKIKKALADVSKESTKRVSKEEFMALVQKKALELYVQSGYQSGRDLDNWLTAEKLVKEGFSYK